MPEEVGEDVKVSKYVTRTFAGYTGIGIKKAKPCFGGCLNVNFISAEGSY